MIGRAITIILGVRKDSKYFMEGISIEWNISKHDVLITAAAAGDDAGFFDAHVGMGQKLVTNSPWWNMKLTHTQPMPRPLHLEPFDFMLRVF